ncbi:hypothetical protein EEJ42_32925, partial [Streptomyces botrytidirepellens]
MRGADPASGMSLAGRLGPSYPFALRGTSCGEGSHDVNTQSPSPQRSRTRRRVFFASVATAAALSSQLLTMAPVQADDTTMTGGGHPKPPQPPTIIHGVREFTADGTFTPPPGVTSVHIQAWGAGGGGGGGGGGSSAAAGGTGGGG